MEDKTKISVENYRKSLDANTSKTKIAGRSVLLAMSNGISKRFLEDFEYLQLRIQNPCLFVGLKIVLLLKIC